MALNHYLRSVSFLILVLLISACQQEQAQQQTAATPTSTSSASRSCILSAGWGERIPFHYRAPDGSVFGIDIDVLTYLADQAGCAMRYRYVPERQQMERLKNGDIDLLLGSYVGTDTPSGVVLSDPYRMESYDLHVISGSPVHRDDLEMLIKLDFNLGLTNGYSYEEPVTTLQSDILHKNQFILAEDSATNINNLLSGEVDGILEEQQVVKALADRALVEGRVEHMGINAGTQQVYIQFNEEKVPAEVIAKFNDAINQMKQDGVFDQIVERHS